ncbi:MAG: ABC transporter ATP-binding protein [Candidatus Methylomirabilis sp.]|nr:ABC transporter ATP-binding protein [Deltaproteobacteria bacterium]
MIHIEALTKIFVRGRAKGAREIRAVDNLHLDVKEGQVFGLLGPNGAGKTTTIRMLACLMPPTSGRFTVGGVSHTDPQRFRTQVGALIEQPGLYHRLTLLEYLTFFGRLYRIEPAALSRRIEMLADLLEINDRLNSRLAGFSLGMRQKAAIARILLHDPPVLLLDEPTAGLDPIVTRKIRRFILDTEGKTTLLSTHHLDEADRVCDMIAVINHGRVLAVDTPKGLRRRHRGRARVRVTLRELRGEFGEAIQARVGAENIDEVEGDSLTYFAEDPEETNPRVVADLVARGADVVGVETRTKSLEEIYVDLLGGWREVGEEGL